MSLCSFYVRYVIMRDIITQPRLRPHMIALESSDETESKKKSDARSARTKYQLGSKRATYSEHHIFLLSNPSNVRASKRASARLERYPVAGIHLNFVVKWSEVKRNIHWKQCKWSEVKWCEVIVPGTPNEVKWSEVKFTTRPRAVSEVKWNVVFVAEDNNNTIARRH